MLARLVVGPDFGYFSPVGGTHGTVATRSEHRFPAAPRRSTLPTCGTEPSPVDRTTLMHLECVAHAHTGSTHALLEEVFLIASSRDKVIVAMGEGVVR